jgi:hypothetical protein
MKSKYNDWLRQNNTDLEAIKTAYNDVTEAIENSPELKAFFLTLAEPLDIK